MILYREIRHLHHTRPSHWRNIPSRSNEIDRDCATKVSTWRQSLEIEFFHRSRLFPRCLAARIISLASGTSLQLRPSLPPLILAARLAVVTALFFLSPPPSPLSSPTPVAKLLLFPGWTRGWVTVLPRSFTRWTLGLPRHPSRED